MKELDFHEGLGPHTTTSKVQFVPGRPDLNRAEAERASIVEVDGRPALDRAITVRGREVPVYIHGQVQQS